MQDNSNANPVEHIRDLRQRRVHQVVGRNNTAREPLLQVEKEHEEKTGRKLWHTRGYLPHFDNGGAIQMVTFRLADALPAALRQEWEALLSVGIERERRHKIEEYLDQGRGECYLRQAPIAEVVEGALLNGNGSQYRLAAWVVMPNHVHVVVELWGAALPGIIKSWKGYTARMANRLLQRQGPFWQEDYRDRYVRDEAHFGRALRYIENNPVKAGLVGEAAAWPYSSANPKWRWETQGGRFTRYRGAEVICEKGT